MNCRFVFYYTKGNGYEAYANELERSLQRFKVPYFGLPIKNVGNWQKNTQLKASFLTGMRNKFVEPLVYIDCDSKIVALPTYFDSISEDIGFSVQDFPWHKQEALSGTVYLANNQRVRDFLFLWDKLNKVNTTLLEQENMKKASEKIENLTVATLPPELCYIFDHSKINSPDVTPVILQLQASRKLKR